ncbi:MAG: sugar phosphate nucleotidyltransferase, partial [Chlamydiota bacterium]
AGGQGTRLFPLTLNHCKPAVFFGGNYRLIDIPISNSLNSDMRHIFVLAQYLSTELHHHLSQTYQFDAFHPGSLDFLTPAELPSKEKIWFEGTADAVRKTLPTILESPADYFLILSGDQLYNINFQKMLEFAIEKKADLTIASLPVVESDAKRLGLLKIDDGSKIVDFAEKPKEDSLLQSFTLPKSFHEKWDLPNNLDKNYLGSMGIYIFKRDVLTALLEEDSREDFGKHLIPTQIKKGKSYAFVYNGYWEDIGTISSFYEANLALTKNKLGLNTYDESNPIFSRLCHLPGPRVKDCKITDSIICDGSIIFASEITNSIIGLRSHIQKGTIIKKSILAPNHYYYRPENLKYLPENFGIGQNCQIENTIIDEHVKIGNNVTLINQKNLDTFDGEGIYIRDGIIIVSANTHIPDNYIL